MSMSKKDYEIIADAVAETRAVIERDGELTPAQMMAVDGAFTTLVNNFGQRFKKDNSSFDKARFTTRYFDALRSRKTGGKAKVSG